MNWKFVVLTGALFAALPLSAGQVVVNFDDVNAGGSSVGMPSGYGGILWEDYFGLYGVDQFPYNARSGPNRALTNFRDSSGGSSTFSFAAPGGVTFGGAWFAGYSITTLSVELYLAGSRVYSTGTFSLSDTPTLRAGDYTGLVDAVTILGRRGSYVFDDVTYNTVGDVPEPATVGLMGLGGLLLVFVRRKAIS